jgi:hypothetical protein
VLLIGLALLLLALAVFFIPGRFIAGDNPARVVLGYGSVVLWALGALLGTFAWIGALVRMAQLRRWGWFAALLLINVAMFMYIHHGPDEPA